MYDTAYKVCKLCDIVMKFDRYVYVCMYVCMYTYYVNMMLEQQIDTL